MIDPPVTTGGGTGDRDEEARADDRDARWGAIDLLLHGDAVGERPAPAGAGGGGTGPSVGPAAPDRRRVGGATTSSGPDRPRPFYGPREWTVVLEAESARRLRYERPCLVLQAEIRGIAAIAERFGAPSAERLVAILADQLRRTRRTDLYARTDRWRFQGLLTETGAAGIDAYVGRLRRGYGLATGPALPLGLSVGIVAPEPGERLVATVGRAEQAMYGDAHRRDDAPARPAAPGGRRDVREALRELEELRLEGLVTAEEYRDKRVEVLARL